MLSIDKFILDTTKKRERRNHSAQLKAQILAECEVLGGEGGASTVRTVSRSADLRAADDRGCGTAPSLTAAAAH